MNTHRFLFGIARVLLALSVLFLKAENGYGAFRRMSHAAMAATAVAKDTAQSSERIPPLSRFQRHVTERLADRHSFRGGFAAYLSVGLGALGLIFFGLQTTALMMLFGIAAGVAGKVGLKRYKHDRLLKTLCYIGIGLGALLVVFATIPILFLL